MNWVSGWVSCFRWVAHKPIRLVSSRPVNGWMVWTINGVWKQHKRVIKVLPNYGCTFQNRFQNGDSHHSDEESWTSRTTPTQAFTTRNYSDIWNNRSRPTARGRYPGVIRDPETFGEHLKRVSRRPGFPAPATPGPTPQTPDRQIRILIHFKGASAKEAPGRKQPQLYKRSGLAFRGRKLPRVCNKVKYILFAPVFFILTECPDIGKKTREGNEVASYRNSFGQR